MYIEMSQLNKTNKGIYHYLEGKYFMSMDPNLQQILIENIIEKEGQCIVYLKQNIISYEEKFDSIMRLFEFYYNKGYRLVL